MNKCKNTLATLRFTRACARGEYLGLTFTRAHQMQKCTWSCGHKNTSSPTDHPTKVPCPKASHDALHVLIVFPHPHHARHAAFICTRRTRAHACNVTDTYAPTPPVMWWVRCTCSAVPSIHCVESAWYSTTQCTLIIANTRHMSRVLHVLCVAVLFFIGSHVHNSSFRTTLWRACTSFTRATREVWRIVSPRSSCVP